MPVRGLIFSGRVAATQANINISRLKEMQCASNSVSFPCPVQISEATQTAQFSFKNRLLLHAKNKCLQVRLKIGTFTFKYHIITSTTV